MMRDFAALSFGAYDPGCPKISYVPIGGDLTPFTESWELRGLLFRPISCRIYGRRIEEDYMVPQVALRGAAKDFRAQADGFREPSNLAHYREFLEDVLSVPPEDCDQAIDGLEVSANQLAEWFEKAAETCSYVLVSGL